MTFQSLFKAGIIAVIIINAFGTGALAADPTSALYRSQQSGRWHDPNTWEVQVGSAWQDAEGYPDFDDGATIRQHDVTLTGNVTCGEILVEHDGAILTGKYILTVSIDDLDIDAAGSGQDPGTVYVGASGMLKLTAGASSDFLLDGSVVLTGAQSTLRFDGNPLQTVKGTGTIVGQSSSASIQIKESTFLFNHILIQGAMVIKPTSGTAVFGNVRTTSAPAGIVRANCNGTLELAADLIIDDFIGSGYMPSYEAVSTPNATLKFSNEATGWPNPTLVAHIVIDDCATMEFCQSVITAGSLTQSGTVCVATDMIFMWNSGVNYYEEGCHTSEDCE